MERLFAERGEGRSIYAIMGDWWIWGRWRMGQFVWMELLLLDRGPEVGSSVGDWARSCGEGKGEVKYTPSEEVTSVLRTGLTKTHFTLEPCQCESGLEFS